MHCISCGTLLPDDARFCQRCGKEQPGKSMELAVLRIAEDTHGLFDAGTAYQIALVGEMDGKVIKEAQLVLGKVVLIARYVSFMRELKSDGWRLPTGGDPIEPEYAAIMAGGRALAQVIEKEETSALLTLHTSLGQRGQPGQAIETAMHAVERQNGRQLIRPTASDGAVAGTPNFVQECTRHAKYIAQTLKTAEERDNYVVKLMKDDLKNEPQEKTTVAEAVFTWYREEYLQSNAERERFGVRLVEAASQK